MPRNREIKAKIRSLESVTEVSRLIGAEFHCRMDHVDTYFDVRWGRLKLREIDARNCELISYRREEGSTQRLSEFMVYPIARPEPLKSMLISTLGVRGIVEKRRTVYLYRATRIHADEVDKLGLFLELETKVGTSPDAAAEEMNLLIRAFSVQEADFITFSYIDMISG